MGFAKPNLNVHDASASVGENPTNKQTKKGILHLLDLIDIIASNRNKFKCIEI